MSRPTGWTTRGTLSAERGVGAAAYVGLRVSFGTAFRAGLVRRFVFALIMVSSCFATHSVGFALGQGGIYGAGTERQDR